MEKLMTSCALVLYEKADNVIFPGRQEATFPVPCGTGSVNLIHTWRQKVFFNIPTDFRSCEDEITSGLANRLNFDPDLSTEYPFAFFKRVQRDKCFNIEYDLYTVFNQYNLILIPIIGGNVGGAGKGGTLYVPSDKKLDRRILLDSFCCTNADDFALSDLESPSFGMPTSVALAGFVPPPSGEVSLSMDIPVEVIDQYAQTAPSDVIAYLSMGKMCIYILEGCEEQALVALGAKTDREKLIVPGVEGTFDLQVVSYNPEQCADYGQGGTQVDEPKEGAKRVKKGYRCGKLQPASIGKCRPFVNNTYSRLERYAFAVCLRRPGETCIETYKEIGRIKVYCDKERKNQIAEFATFAWVCQGGK